MMLCVLGYSLSTCDTDMHCYKQPSCPIDSYLLTWSPQLGALQGPLCLHSHPLVEQILTLQVKLLHFNIIPKASFSPSFFSLTKESTEMSFTASSFSNVRVSSQWEIKACHLLLADSGEMQASVLTAASHTTA